MTIINRGGAETWWKKKLPAEVSYMYKEYGYGDWVPVTWREIFAKRKAHQEARLRSKRNSPKLKPAFVWVFHNNTGFFCGWWIYIKTLKEDHAINFRTRDAHHIMEKAMSLFPCGVIPSKQNFEQWAEAFVTQFAHIGFKRKNNQGLAKCWCEIDQHGSLVNLKIR